MTISGGGNALNAAVTMRRLGIDVQIVSNVLRFRLPYATRLEKMNEDR